jgi:hypothetical protein
MKNDDLNVGAKVNDHATGCISIFINLLLVGVGVYWFVTAEIDIGYKGLYFEGSPARILALLWIMSWSTPVLVSWAKRSISSNKSPPHE